MDKVIGSSAPVPVPLIMDASRIMVLKIHSWQLLELGRSVRTVHLSTFREAAAILAKRQGVET